MKNQKGITLVALVVTIVVLIILAVISINIVFGQNGIIRQTQKSRKKQEIAEYMDKFSVAEATTGTKNKGEVTLELFIAELEIEGIIPKTNIVKSGDIYELTAVEGYIFEARLKKENDVEVTYKSKGENTGNAIIITLNETSKTIMLGDTFTLTATIAPESVEVTKLEWSSKNVNIATVDEKGEVTGEEIGETTITVKVTDQKGMTAKKSMKVTVVENPEIIDIGTVEELKKIGQNEAYPLDGRYRLVENIDLEGEAWTPIVDFEGEFNGNKKTISNLNINTTGNLGLFANLKDNAIVKKLTIDSATVKGGNNAGTLAGVIDTASNITIEDIIINVNLIGTATTTYAKSGMIGKIIGSNNINITNCRIEGELKSARTSGIIGNIENSQNIIIQKCSTNCKISSSGVSVQWGLLSGFIGSITTESDNIEINKCYSEGEIIGSGSYESIGGFIGSMHAPKEKNVIEECYSTCNITDTTGHSAGGFIGQTGVYSTTRGKNYIKNCYATGNVNMSSAINNCKGGFIGMLQSYNTTGSGTVNVGTIENCYAAGTSSANGFFGGTYAQISITPTMTFTNNYWDSTKTTTANSSTYATGKPTTGMQIATPFTGWDSEVWHFEEGKYPILKWQIENVT